MQSQEKNSDDRAGSKRKGHYHVITTLKPAACSSRSITIYLQATRLWRSRLSITIVIHSAASGSGWTKERVVVQVNAACLQAY